LAVAHSGSSTVFLVEVLTGQERHELTGANSTLTSLTFSGDGKKLVSGHTDTTALLWDLTGRVSGKVETSEALTPADLNALWAELSRLNGEKSYQAMLRLTAAPRHTLPFLRNHLQPVALPEERRIEALLADLDSARFAIQDKATQELEAIGETAAPAFYRAQKGKLSF
jgi:hypothetical protein